MLKKKYIKPTLHVQYVLLEESLMASSAQLTGGENQNSPYTPGVELWGEEINGGTQKGDY